MHHRSRLYFITLALLPLALAAGCSDSPPVTPQGDNYQPPSGDNQGSGGDSFVPSGCTVVAVTPANNATNVSIDTGVRFQFSGAVVASSLASRIGLNQAGSPVAVGTPAVTGNLVTITPAGQLATNTQYTAWAEAGIECNSATLGARVESVFTTGTQSSNAPQGFLFSPVGGTASGGGYTVQIIGGRGTAGTASGGGYTVQAEGAYLIQP